jgi:hypothetical protein
VELRSSRVRAFCSLGFRLLNILALAKDAAVMNKSDPLPPSMRGSTLWLAMDLDGSLFKRRWCGGNGILMVNLCPRAPCCDGVGSSVGAELGRLSRRR